VEPEPDLVFEPDLTDHSLIIRLFVEPEPDLFFEPVFIVCSLIIRLFVELLNHWVLITLVC